ncbi:hypothetical protein GCM10023331_08550 [Algivirga pacifica]|uniref:Uncharacterized protein n=1 Tax=Algivirga pacifica TaxID=1162670 RepID=A0ABP9D4H2_9BACT
MDQKEHVEYNLNLPDNRWDLPPILKEVSGITYWKGGLILAVQDEEGEVYVYDLNQKRVVEGVIFGRAEDYEGIAVREEECFVINSTGELHRFSLEKGRLESQQYILPFTRKNDIEGLCLDAAKTHLLILPKGAPSLEGKKGKKSVRKVYQWNIDKEVLEPEERFRIYSKRFDDLNPDADDKFAPSDLAVHPLTGDYYILAHKGKKLLVCTAEGDPKDLYLLDEALFEQAEGITFLPDGELLISSEGKWGRGYILSFKMQ